MSKKNGKAKTYKLPAKGQAAKPKPKAVALMSRIELGDEVELLRQRVAALEAERHSTISALRTLANAITYEDERGLQIGMAMANEVLEVVQWRS